MIILLSYIQSKIEISWLIIFLNQIGETLNIFEIICDFMSNWYLGKRSLAVEKSSFETWQTATRARTKNVEGFTAHADRMDPAVNDDTRPGWCREERSCAFSRSGALFHMWRTSHRTMVQWFSQKSFWVRIVILHNRFSEQRSFIVYENKTSWKVVKVYLRNQAWS